MATIGDISWEVVPFSWGAAERLARELHLPLAAATVLAGRGFAEPANARAFLECSDPIPDPFLFADMETVVQSILQAAAQGRRVVVHGDYDADGITATALMVLGLRAFGLEPEWYLPSRFTEGFGLSATAVRTIAAQGPALLITVDCGVNYPDEVALAQTLGLAVAVVDHHQPGSTLPDCPLIHPVRGEYPTAALCGVGLAFKVLQALHVRANGAPLGVVPDALHPFLDLVAVGTIADLAPLLGENRYYAKEGLKLLTIGSRPGLRALSRVAGCSGAVDSGAVSFRLAPRLNAAGRLADASPPLRLLLTEDEEEASAVAEQLHELNGARQDVEKSILEEALAQVEALPQLPPVLVLSGTGWHEGVVGIVASRLVERYYRPVLLLGEREGIAKGSGRSIAGYDLMSGLNACAQWLTVFGGHTQAVGLTLEAERLPDFCRAMEEHAGAWLSAADVRPVYRADAVLRGEDINADTAQALAGLGPFGSGNPRPRLLLVDAALRQVETTRTGTHLRCVVDVDGVKIRAIGFGLGESAPELREDGEGRLLGVQLRIDEWQGALRPEFQLERIGGAVPLIAGALACGPECPHWAAVAASEGGEDAAAATQARAAGHQAQTGSAPRARECRDLREAGGRLAAVAQVLATGEPTVLLACSVPHCLEELAARLPLADLTGGRLQCVGRGCAAGSAGRIDPAGVVICEWDAALAAPALAGRDHVVALDPPYREAHAALLRRLGREGRHVHLCYGEEQRSATATLLRYLVHPRFAMVCLYRALTGGSPEHEVHREAARLAWQEGGVVLTGDAFIRAGEVLAGLGLERLENGRAKIEPESIPAYAEAEADYEECARLCRTL